METSDGVLLNRRLKRDPLQFGELVDRRTSVEATMSTMIWVDAVSADALPVNDVKGVAVAGRGIAIYAVGTEVYATENLCTHGNARLCEGLLNGFEIECPLHQGKFDVRDGRPTCAPVTAPLKSYPIRIEDVRVLVRLN